MSMDCQLQSRAFKYRIVTVSSFALSEFGLNILTILASASTSPHMEWTFPVKMSIGDGKNSFFWFDFRNPLGPLYKNFSENLLHSLGLSKRSSIDNGAWKWPKGRRLNTEVKILG
ncbi:hypothetical protein ACH5RR_032330 [Cinchona calisaya]|uniref:Uncharacterized protein n=1 Tax=Cinchona calisaya TaxID=153742 RepID=A0ABD2YIW3_9GENT